MGTLMHYRVLARRALCLLPTIFLLASCGSPPQQTGNGRPKSPLDLPAVAANLDLTGPVNGHVSEMRMSECRKRPDPDGNFYASGYFQIGNDWYFLQLIAISPLPAAGNHSGYTGPGHYQALVDFRDMKVYPGGMINGDHAWGGPVNLIETLTIAPDGHTVSVGSATGTKYQPILGTRLTLWPQRTDQTGPPPEPAPAPGQVVTIQGSCHCP